MIVSINDIATSWGLRCPHCKSCDEIDIAATVWVRLCPDGTDPALSYCGDHAWTDDSEACCNACGFDGRVRDFHVT